MMDTAIYTASIVPLYVFYMLSLCECVCVCVKVIVRASLMDGSLWLDCTKLQN